MNGALILLALVDGAVREDAETVERLCACAGGAGVALDGPLIDEVRERIERFLRARRVSHVVDLAALHVARARRVLLRRADSIARGAPREMRPRIAPLLRAVRAAATAPLSAGAERALDQLAGAALPDEAWLRAIGEFEGMRTSRPPAPPAELLALLILRAD